MYSLYNRIRPFDVPTLLVFSYCGGVLVDGTAAQKKVVSRIAKVELSLLSIGAFLRAVRGGPVEQLSFSRLVDECDGQGVLMKVRMPQSRSSSSSVSCG